MEIKLVREHYKPDSTIGRLLVDGTFECFTLEDGVRTTKVFGETAIPPGSYRVTVTMSPRFKRLLPRLHDVPNFDGVLIHPGNTAADTHGCILVGQAWQPGQETIGASRAAFAALFAKIQEVLATAGDVSIEIVQQNAPREIVMRSVRGGAARAGTAKPKRKAAKIKKPVRKKPAAKKTIKRVAASGRKALAKTKPRRRRS